MGLARFRHAFRALLPRWLGGGPDPRKPPVGFYGPPEWDDGRKVAYALGVVKDAFVERARVGLISRFPEFASTSALNVIGRDRRMTRGLGESDAAWARRLVQWRFPRGHRVRGNPFALLTQIQAYLPEKLRVRTVDRRGNWYELSRDGVESYYWNRANWNWGVFTGPDWSRFWVIIYVRLPSEVGDPEALWERPKWGERKYGAANAHWGTTATNADHESIRTIIREWKPAGTMQETVLIAFGDDDDVFNPLDVVNPPTAEWYRYSSYDAGVRVPIRESSVRYWYFSPRSTPPA